MNQPQVKDPPGGAREGSGRKPLLDEPMRSVVVIRMTAEQKAAISNWVAGYYQGEHSLSSWLREIALCTIDREDLLED